MRRIATGCLALSLVPSVAKLQDDEPWFLVPAHAENRSFSGVLPDLASFNGENECGIGAVVPWTGSLYWITYAPHRPRGSDDRLHRLDADGRHFVFAQSVGGTPANRMIHRESRQLLIGPYLIDEAGTVRVLTPERMPGRLTGNARHLFEPERKVYYATMEEGLYSVDVFTLEVEELFPDGNDRGDVAGALLPGAHGKGLFSSQGVLIYANNGESGPEALRRPDVPSGVLAEWDGVGDWTTVHRGQFTDIAGPGDLHGDRMRGAADDGAPNDPIWSIGFDHRSLILRLREAGSWHEFRLPKTSHCYDGAHGWNTEWPRIRALREPGEDPSNSCGRFPKWAMTMHGAFWEFPATFRVGHTRGVRPLASYLRVVGDFCQLGDQLVFGCDDAARAEFLNRRASKGELAGPRQSQSNLWFVDENRFQRLGPALLRGAIWVAEPVPAEQWSTPMLLPDVAWRSLHLAHEGESSVRFGVQVDREGDGRWQELCTLSVERSAWLDLSRVAAAWLRVAVDTAVTATVALEARARDERPNTVRDPQRLPAAFRELPAASGRDRWQEHVCWPDASRRDCSYSRRASTIRRVRRVGCCSLP